MYLYLLVKYCKYLDLRILVMSYVNALLDFGSHENPLALHLELLKLRNYDVILAYSNNIKNDQNLKKLDCAIIILL